MPLVRTGAAYQASLLKLIKHLKLLTDHLKSRLPSTEMTYKAYVLDDKASKSCLPSTELPDKAHFLDDKASVGLPRLDSARILLADRKDWVSNQRESVGTRDMIGWKDCCTATAKTA